MVDAHADAGLSRLGHRGRGRPDARRPHLRRLLDSQRMHGHGGHAGRLRRVGRRLGLLPVRPVSRAGEECTKCRTGEHGRPRTDARRVRRGCSSGRLSTTGRSERSEAARWCGSVPGKRRGNDTVEHGVRVPRRRAWACEPDGGRRDARRSGAAQKGRDRSASPPRRARRSVRGSLCSRPVRTSHQRS